METIYLVAVGAVLALVFSFIMYRRVKREPEGTKEMAEISASVQKGANAYLKRQYKGVILFFAAVFVILLVMAFMDYLSFFTPFAFVTGGFFSGLSGFIGMRTATMANCRTAFGASKSLNRGLKVAFSAGSVMGFTVVGLGLLDLSVWYLILRFFYTVIDPVETEELLIENITSNMLTFGMGASSMALFARVGGGIFTKAADVGADLVGKVEAGIPEDDPRNPAVIADNVGDNVGDVAGMGADLYESYVGSVVSTAALAVAAGFGMKGVSVPMLLAAFGILSSIVGTFFVRTKEGASQKNLLRALRTGTYISAVLIAVISYLLIRYFLPDHMGVFVAVISGLIAGILIGAITEYYTSDTYSPTRKLSESSETGAGTVIISGLSLGMLSIVTRYLRVVSRFLISYFASGGAADFNMGLYGIGVSAVGCCPPWGLPWQPMPTVQLRIMPVECGDDPYAGGSEGADRCAGFPGQYDGSHREGFAIGSAALTALALIASYIDKVKTLDPNYALDLSITNPTVLVGLFVGGMLPFLFAALTMSAVGKAAQSIVVEVRRQFKKFQGLWRENPNRIMLPAWICVLAPLSVSCWHRL